MTYYKECNLKLRIADSTTRSIGGYRDISYVFPSRNGLVDVVLTTMAHVPDRRYHLLSMPTLIKNSHTFEGRPTGVIAILKSERLIVFPLRGTLFSVYGYRVDPG